MNKNVFGFETMLTMKTTEKITQSSEEERLYLTIVSGGPDFKLVKKIDQMNMIDQSKIGSI